GGGRGGGEGGGGNREEGRAGAGVMKRNDEKLHEPFFRQARMRARALGGDLTELGASLLKQNKHAEAERVLRECLPVLQEKQPDTWPTFHTQSLLGESLSGQGKYTEAEPLLVRGYEGMNQREAAIPATFKFCLTEALERLVQLYDSLNKPADAAKWRNGVVDPWQGKTA